MGQSVALTELVNPTDLISPAVTSRRRAMMSAALALLKRAGKGLLDADWNPWVSGIPAYAGDIWKQPAMMMSDEQASFANTLAIVRNILQKPAHGLVAYRVTQTGSVPSHVTQLNLLFYLSAEGYDLDFRWTRNGPEYTVDLVVP